MSSSYATAKEIKKKTLAWDQKPTENWRSVQINLTFTAFDAIQSTCSSLSIKILHSSSNKNVFFFVWR